MRVRHLTTIVFGLALFACASPDTGRMGGQDQGEQPIPGQQAPTGADGADTRTPGERADADRTGPLGREAVPTSAYAPVLDPTQASPRPAENFVAYVHGTKANPRVQGTIHFRPSGQNVEVQADLQGLPAGEHQLFVSTYGDCSAPERDSAGPPLDFSALGGAPGQRPGTPAPTGAPGPEGTPGTTPPTGGGATGATDGGQDETRTAQGGTTAGGEPSGATGPGTTGAPGTPGAPETATAMGPGMLGTIDATGGAAQMRSTVSTLSAQNIGALAARSVVVYADTTPAKAGETATTGTPQGDPIACGVIGIAGEAATPTTPASIAPVTR